MIRLISKLILFIILICFAGPVAAQEETVRLAPAGPSQKDITIEGVVTDCANKVPIEAAIISIYDSEGFVRLVRTDKAGYYSVKVSGKLLYVVSCDAAGAQPTNYSVRYMGTTEKGKIDPKTNYSGRFRKDFCLMPAPGCIGYFPAFLFDRNSSAYAATQPSDVTTADSALVYLKRILDDNPAIVIELNGHCSSEEAKAQQLSEQRAHKVKEDLIKLGIAGDRIVCKGYSYKRLLLKDPAISKLRTKEEKDIARAKNRRVVAKVLRWDYPTDTQSAPPGITPKKYEDNEDDSGEKN